MKTFFLFFLLVLVLCASFVAATGETPIGLQKIIDYNQQHTLDFGSSISFFIAFLAGMLVILSPCFLPLFPAYFSYTFKEKRNITGMTLVFFAGFALVFVVLGILAGFLGQQTLTILQPGWLVLLAGFFMLYLAFVSFFGKKACPFINIGNRFHNDIPGTFLFGMFFAVGWTACLGPILAGILAIGAVLGSVAKAAVLMFFYAIGNFVPLIMLAMGYDRIKEKHPRFFAGRMVRFSAFDRDFIVPLTNVISGALFFLIGLVLIIFQGTGVINAWDVLGTKKYFYAVQGAMLAWPYIHVVSVAVFAVFFLVVAWFLYHRARKD